MCYSFNVINTIYDINNSENSNSDDSIIIVDDPDSDPDSDHDSVPDSDPDSDPDNEHIMIYDSILDEDAEHFYAEKTNNNYYIGLYHSYRTPSHIHYFLLSTSVSAKTFLNHSYENVNKYLYYYGLIRIPNHNIQIMQLKIHTINGMETYNVIIKTYWLRLIQRHWKKIYKQRLSIIKQRITPTNILYNSIHGNYPLHIRHLPSLNSMLSTYQN